MAEEQTRTDLSEIIAENFGANATYVETLLARWQSNPALVDESWRAYFEELAGMNGDAAAAPKAQTEVVAKPKPSGDGAAAKQTNVEHGSLLAVDRVRSPTYRMCKADAKIGMSVLY